jgi:SAM-dependent methyltransferase
VVSDWTNRCRGLLDRFKYTLLHPQWLSYRFHRISQACLANIHHSLVLDVGSGDSNLIAHLGAANFLVRLDYPATNKRYAQRPEAYADARSLPIADHTADVVTLLEVLEHVDGHEIALQEVSRVLKADGRLFLSVPFIYPIHDAPWDFQRFTRFGLIALLRRNGMHPVVEICHGHSLLTAIQLTNLALMELARDLSVVRPTAGLLVAAALYPVTLAMNLLALPLTWVRWNSAAPLGYFVVAEKRS